MIYWPKNNIEKICEMQLRDAKVEKIKSESSAF